MELQRILAKDSRSAMEQVHTLYGKDALVVSNKRAKNKTELIVAVDLEADLKNSLDEINLGNCGHHLSSSSNFQDVMEEKVFGTQVQEKDMVSDKGILMAVPNEYEDQTEDSLREREKLRSREIVDLVKQEFAIMRREFKLSQQNGDHSLSSEMSPILEALTEVGMPVKLKAYINSLVDQNGSISDIFKNVSTEIGSNLHSKNILENMEGVHIITGSSGVGKTLLSAKIARQKAVEYGEDEVAIISYNDKRFGAWSQSQLLSAKIGIEIFRCSSLDSLEQVMGEVGSRKLVLIDTSAYEVEKTIKTLESLLPLAKKHLVIGSDTSERSATSFLQDFDSLWDSVMLSKLEKECHPWPIISALFNRDEPLGLYSDSQSVMDDLMPITGSELVAKSLDQLKHSFV
jgi:flagellar biosynthesis protein FlhF|tara:strand:- start:24412 stop:25617 length:1206 start_codon:yes stop_codon:yes gene_type:complete